MRQLDDEHARFRERQQEKQRRLHAMWIWQEKLRVQQLLALGDGWYKSPLAARGGRPTGGERSQPQAAAGEGGAPAQPHMPAFDEYGQREFVALEFNALSGRMEEVQYFEDANLGVKRLSPRQVG